MHVKPLPVRRGRPVCFTLDRDAEQLLRAMAPHSKGLGMLVAELIRKEARERVLRGEWVATLQRQADATALD